MSYACPKCKSTNLTIVVSTKATFVQGEDGPMTTDYEGDEWDEQSPMQCTDCEFSGVVAQFNQGGTE
jgi:hypothetical protein